MKKLVAALLISATSMTMVISEAEAKRMGGGGSVGRQSQSVNRQALPPANQPAAPNQAARPAQGAPAATPPAQAPRPASPWRNILGGALLGLGLGALLAHLGIGGALANIIAGALMIGLLVLAAMFIYRMLRRNDTPASPAKHAYADGMAHPQPETGVRTPEIGSRLNQPAQPAAFQADSALSGAAVGAGAAAGASTAATDFQPWGVPADFDTTGFLRHAKTYFIRLQTAWDKADIDDIREFSTPEMFAELRMQLQERGPSPNHTDVVSLDAQLLGIEETDRDHVASVLFSGMIREADNAPTEQFSEVWNLVKPRSGPGGWVLAGIQQVPAGH